MRARAVAALLAVSGCTAGSTPGAAPTSPSPSTSASVSPSATSQPSASTSPSSTPPATAVDYGGQRVRWPYRFRGPAPVALGAVLTLEHVERSDGGTLAPGLTLPRVGGTAAAPVVLSPCGARVTLHGRVERIAPSGPGDVLVVVDPGHGGRADGTHAPDGTREADVVLDLARRTATDLRRAGERVVLTRTSDIEATLEFRAALADALRADLALSVHLNASPETTSRTPGSSVYGSVADPSGRRAAGVVYASVRHYLERWTPTVGRWAANRDSGALYRLGRTGNDYYGLFRAAHVTWVIAESAYLSAPREAALLQRDDVRSGLAAALAAGAEAVTTTQQPGSGWRVPLPRPPDPPPVPLPGHCTDPA